MQEPRPPDRPSFIFNMQLMRETESELIKIHPLVVGRLQTNCYILESRAEAIVVDPGDEPERIIRLIKDLTVTTTHILATHAHFDHVLAVDGVRSVFKTPFLIHKDDSPILESMQTSARQFTRFEAQKPPKVDRFVRDDETLKLGSETIRVIHTPGHSPGSISLSGDGYVLTGDALFNQSIGRTDLPGGDFQTLVDSITNRLFKLNDETIVYPGHGPETNIGDEKLANPFVGSIARRTS
jgi:hydroxyacylglutathione hydrolase